MLGILSKTVLFPYFIVLKIRHFLYDKQIFKSKSYPIPIICIGNITVGGTGKTPHTEMIIRLLKDSKNIAVLSRGYKRKSKGFRLVETTNTHTDVGDEPLQIKQKFPDVTVAVCKNRGEGIERLMQLKPGLQMILLDDAFQHRHVRPWRNIVLINYKRTICGDNLLPIGRLRDLPEQIRRADDIIITKSPAAVEIDGFTDEEKTLARVKREEVKWRKELNLLPTQNIYFSTIYYGSPAALFPNEADIRYTYSGNAVYFTGIADDKEFKNYLVSIYKIAASIKFSDHRNFTKHDISRITEMSRQYPTAVIFTTEKDSKRLLNCKHLNNNLKTRLFYIPIEVKIVPEAMSGTFKDSLANTGNI